MSYATEHRELGRRVQLEGLAHPWEEVSKTVMPSLDTFRDTSTSAGERKCTDAVRAQDDIGVDITQLLRASQDVLTSHFSADDGLVWRELQSRYFDPDFELRIDERAHRRADDSRTFENHQCPWLGDLEVYGLPRRRVRGV